MKKTSNTSTKRSPGRPKKKETVNTTNREVVQKMGVPTLFEPTEHDMYDELARLDSFAYSRYNR